MKYGFIGAGNIAEAIIKGILKNKLADSNDIYINDTNTSRMAQLSKELSVTPVATANELVKRCGVIFLTVKPNVVESVLSDIRQTISIEKPLLISVAAGKTLGFIGSCLGFDTAVVRAMPNVNAAVAESMTVICANETVTEKQVKIAVDCFNAVGGVYVAKESDMPVLTALCSCAPAFSYLYIDSLAKAAHKSGIDKKTARRLAAQTVLGSAKMLLESDEHAWEHIERVCSPGGVTIEGICSLEENRFQSIVVAAVDAAANKDKRL